LVGHAVRDSPDKLNHAALSAVSAITRIAVETVLRAVTVIARAIHSDEATMATAVKRDC